MSSNNLKKPQRYRNQKEGESLESPNFRRDKSGDRLVE